MSASRTMYIGRTSSIPSKFLLWSFGIIVSTFPLYSMPMSVVSITSSK